MSQSTSRNLLLPVFATFLVLVASCSQTIQPSIEPTETASNPLHTATQTLAATSTKPPIKTTTPTFFPSSTSMPSITPQPTSTPIPTLTFDKAREFVLELLQTNGGCQLPCWWGEIIPGQTRWEDAKSFLQTFASEIVLGTPYSNGEIYWVSFSVPETVRYFQVLEVPVNIREGIVDQIFIGQYYPLTHLLIDYGAPTEIWIKAVGEATITPEGRFTIALFWSNKGILAAFDGITEKTNPLPICMDNLEEPEEPALWLWDPKRPRTIEEVGGELLFGFELAKREFFRLEKATNIDIASFYQTYVNADNLSVCFEMPDPDLP